MSKKSQCDDLVRALYEYVDGAGDAQARAQLKKHAEECPSCLEALGIEQQVREILRSSCCEQAPTELRARITRSLRITRVEYRA
ncbi:mycothiol system anti-sigma-R factor [Corynebacterium sp. 320]|uniref:Mycothiol system anti-sigma-R factor n=1 Tax=Corynebacterium zhongnanshanii TaxID=2768834 RepID=A0ABQ6VEY7_9CORY|nr:MULTISPECIES: mycothiol system anti-sigma-R factor [Corynebacterium]KAB1504156.1 mycothiol system anti-sigma-R factor [Corynebacterium sp. 320]KAB1552744.1 mycothiol system anti-sigma-R factor [Corynebacterium sp. 321]KAB1554038.1 mycothiol system anti-sigma-R factor [Corynebacterium sp. 319]KAB3522990.1 mycothiol system anti-sigma-R factor [Corynebacterium zhongnanshanii]KAB3528292.1 mycothiol system anti-sigma-R factor [Corynebacterium sp. 250]